MNVIQEILAKDDPKELKALFAFNSTDSDEAVLFKFNLWMRKFFPKYFTSPDASFHKEIDLCNLQVYRGKLTSFVNIAFRGAAKTARTKLFRGFVLCNDQDKSRKYLKVGAEDLDNAKQIVTDIYNMMVLPSIKRVWPEIFEKTNSKREERMDSFTTAGGVKLVAISVGVSQRGALQDESRPDEIWFEDFESRTTLRSARKTKAIWENMEEARTGLAKNGGCIYTCNYISEQGNVHTLVTKTSSRKKILIQSILNPDGTPSWSRYTIAEIKEMEETDEDFEGERLCKPSASKDVYFDRESLDKQVAKLPVKTIAEFKIFKPYNPSHRYASGHDVAGGVGLDSSTSVFIDFDVIPAQVVATFKSNTIKEDTFGDEIYRESNIFGGSLACPEDNNYGHATIARLKQLDQLMYKKQPKDSKTEAATQSATPTEYGWNTNGLTKSKMLSHMQTAIEKGWIELNDPDLIAEFKNYTRNDLIETVKDPRLTTRHFDMLIACCIAWQMKDHAVIVEKTEELPPEEPEDLLYPEIGY